MPLAGATLPLALFVIVTVVTLPPTVLVTTSSDADERDVDSGEEGKDEAETRVFVAFGRREEEERTMEDR